MPKIVDPEEQRAMIARAAGRVIAEKGLHRTTLTDIARTAGVTTGMIANYFDNKDKIIEAALRVPFQNIENRILERIEEGEKDLVEVLEVAIPASPALYENNAIWVNFWGMVASDDSIRSLNAELHRVGQRIYAHAIRASWPEATHWPSGVFQEALIAVSTLLFGLSAGGITNPGTWTAELQKRELRRALSAIRRDAQEHAKA